MKTENCYSEVVSTEDQKEAIAESHRKFVADMLAQGKIAKQVPNAEGWLEWVITNA